ncbi:MAG TPA: type II secretion system protein GspK [Luteimonas sp.]
MAFERTRARLQRGFVLAMTLWILAAMAVVVGLLTLWALDAVRNAAGEREQVEDLLSMESTRDTLLYLAATRATTRAGLPTEPLGEAERARRLLDDFGMFSTEPRGGELALDDQPYQGLGHARFSLQDEAGLFQLAVPRPEELQRLLRSQGVPQEVVPRFTDALLDYTDADDLRRLEGAESREYRREGRAAPPNRRLLVPIELARVLGWDALPEAARGRLPGDATTFVSGAVNLNTMPEALLPAWVPGCPENCRRLVERRKRVPFASAREIELLLGTPLPGDTAVDYRFLAADTLRLTVWGRSGVAWRIHVRFTPNADQRGPWSILAVHPVPRPPEDAIAQPTGSSLLADAAPVRR